MDDVLIISSGSYEDHLNKVGIALAILLENGLKINISKSKFCRKELEYLGFYLTREGIKPTRKKVEAILNLLPPKNNRQLRRFIGLVNYYRDLWPRRSEILAPLTSLTSVKKKWKWEKEHQEAFDKMKRVVAREVKLSYPNFNKEFEVHTDASDKQLGAVISQELKPIAFY